VEHDLEDGQRQKSTSQAVGRAGEESAAEACDVFQGGVAVQDLDHEPVDDRDGVEAAMSPGVPGLAARGSDRFGFETVSDILPKSLQDGINPVMHQGCLQVRWGRQATPSCREALFFSSPSLESTCP
jgi:hypothetical protein